MSLATHAMNSAANRLRDFLTQLRLNCDFALTTRREKTPNVSPSKSSEADMVQFSITGDGRIPRGSGGRAERGDCARKNVAEWLLRVSLVLTLGGCATSFLHPAIDVPQQFAESSLGNARSEVAWWESFGDPVLAELVRRAAQENRDVRIAAERVRAARAGETISRSWLLPSFDGVGYAGTVRQTLP